MEKAGLEQSLKTWQQKVLSLFVVCVDLKSHQHFCPSTESLAKWPQISCICNVTSYVTTSCTVPLSVDCLLDLAWFCLFVCLLLWVLFSCVGCFCFEGLFLCLFCYESVNVPIWSILMPTAACFCKITHQVKGAQSVALIIIHSTTITFHLPKFYIM